MVTEDWRHNSSGASVSFVTAAGGSGHNLLWWESVPKMMASGMTRLEVASPCAVSFACPVSLDANPSVNVIDLEILMP